MTRSKHSETTWRDRFGPLPPAAENLLDVHPLEAAGGQPHRLQQVEVRGEKVMLTRGGELVLVGGKFPRLTSPEPPSKMRELSDLLENCEPSIPFIRN